MQPILVAVDLSERSASVVNAACTLARQQSAPLILLNVVAPVIGYGLEMYDVTGSAMTERLRALAEQDLERLGRLVPDGLKCERRVVTGFPWQVVCEEAKRANAAMIVIGAHGYTVLDRMLGTTAARVVNHADRPVFVVRDAQKLAA